MKPICAAIAISLAPVSAAAVGQADDDWADAAQTPGDWRLAQLPAGTSATFVAAGGQALFTLACALGDRSIAMTRHGPGLPQALMQVRTQTRSRVLTAHAEGVTGGAIGTSLAASDPLFDAMAVTRGRFAVEVEGSEPLYLPAWAEVTRVIEDCR